MTVEERIERAIHKRVRSRDRYHKAHLGGKARRESRIIHKLRRELLAFTAPRTQYDSCTVTEIPHDARAVAVYLEGICKNKRAVRAWAPDAMLTTIAVRSSEDAHVFDVEAGDATNADAPGWYERHDHERYGKPIFYTSAGNVAALVAELKAHGIKRRKYIIWSAHYTNVRHVCGPLTCGFPKADSTQYTTSGERLDISKCRPSYWRR